MTLPKAQRILLIGGAIILVLQLPWFFIIQYSVNKTEVKTTAKVVRIASSDTHCTGDRPGDPDKTCDHSQREYPVYEYYDFAGTKHEQDDRYFGEYKHNNPLRGLFMKNVGDKVTAYYTKDKPEEVLFMASPLAYTAWLIPLYIAIPILATGGILAITQKIKRKDSGK